MRNIFLRGASLAIVAVVATTAAHAQMAPGFPPAQPAQTAAAAPNTDPSARALVTRDSLTGELRAPHQGEQSFAVVTPEGFTQLWANAPPGAFENVRGQDRTECAEVGADVRELGSIMQETQDMLPELQGLRNEIIGLGKAQQNVALGQVATTGLGTAALCAIPGAGWLYCGGAALAGLGNLLGIGGHHKAEKVDRHARDIDARTRIIDQRTRILDLKERFSWERRMHPSCLIIFPTATTGIDSLHS